MEKADSETNCHMFRTQRNCEFVKAFRSQAVTWCMLKTHLQSSLINNSTKRLQIQNDLIKVNKELEKKRKEVEERRETLTLKWHMLKKKQEQVYKIHVTWTVTKTMHFSMSFSKCLPFSFKTN